MPEHDEHVEDVDVAVDVVDFDVADVDVFVDAVVDDGDFFHHDDLHSTTHSTHATSSSHPLAAVARRLALAAWRHCCCRFWDRKLGYCCPRETTIADDQASQRKEN